MEASTEKHDNRVARYRDMRDMLVMGVVVMCVLVLSVANWLAFMVNCCTFDCDVQSLPWLLATMSICAVLCMIGFFVAGVVVSVSRRRWRGIVLALSVLTTLFCLAATVYLAVKLWFTSSSSSFHCSTTWRVLAYLSQGMFTFFCIIFCVATANTILASFATRGRSDWQLLPGLTVNMTAGGEQLLARLGMTPSRSSFSLDENGNLVGRFRANSEEPLFADGADDSDDLIRVASDDDDPLWLDGVDDDDDDGSSDGGSPPIAPLRDSGAGGQRQRRRRQQHKHRRSPSYGTVIGTLQAESAAPTQPRLAGAAAGMPMSPSVSDRVDID
jgi:hypothetical protein